MASVAYLITVYNKAPYLDTVIKGLAQQQGDFERSFVFVDDGSTDDSREIVRRLTKDWTKVLRLEQPNAGPSSAFNLGLDHVEADYIKALDGDDELTPSATRTLLKAIESTGCLFAFGRRGDNEHQGATPESVSASVITDPLSLSIKLAHTTPSMWLAKTEVVKSVRGCDTGVFIQDYSLELRMARATAFARVDGDVFHAPTRAPGRLSDNEAQTLHDVNLALARFVDEHPDLDLRYRRLAWRRAAGRAWKWAFKRAGRTVFSKECFRHIESCVRPGAPPPRRLLETCEIFRETHPIRLMGAQ
ncbi:MAG: glycosyltransferase family 2 protein [Rhodospirillales bacterium]|nr:MAG: glycosyltransferase family 2 protein [Rhodospirillales bacterium]